MRWLVAVVTVIVLSAVIINILRLQSNEQGHSLAINSGGSEVRSVEDGKPELFDPVNPIANIPQSSKPEGFENESCLRKLNTLAEPLFEDGGKAKYEILRFIRKIQEVESLQMIEMVAVNTGIKLAFLRRTRVPTDEHLLIDVGSVHSEGIQPAIHQLSEHELLLYLDSQHAKLSVTDFVKLLKNNASLAVHEKIYQLLPESTLEGRFYFEQSPNTLASLALKYGSSPIIAFWLETSSPLLADLVTHTEVYWFVRNYEKFEGPLAQVIADKLDSEGLSIPLKNILIKHGFQVDSTDVKSGLDYLSERERIDLASYINDVFEIANDYAMPISGDIPSECRYYYNRRLVQSALRVKDSYATGPDKKTSALPTHVAELATSTASFDPRFTSLAEKRQLMKENAKRLDESIEQHLQSKQRQPPSEVLRQAFKAAESDKWETARAILFQEFSSEQASSHLLAFCSVLPNFPYNHVMGFVEDGGRFPDTAFYSLTEERDYRALKFLLSQGIGITELGFNYRGYFNDYAPLMDTNYIELLEIVLSAPDAFDNQPQGLDVLDYALKAVGSNPWDNFVLLETVMRHKPPVGQSHFDYVQETSKQNKTLFKRIIENFPALTPVAYAE